MLLHILYFYFLILLSERYPYYVITLLPHYLQKAVTLSNTKLNQDFIRESLILDTFLVCWISWCIPSPQINPSAVNTPQRHVTGREKGYQDLLGEVISRYRRYYEDIRRLLRRLAPPLMR